MKTIISTVALLLLVVSMGGGCSSYSYDEVWRRYNGPPQSREEIAVLQIGQNVHLCSMDRQLTPSMFNGHTGSVASVEFLPGEHSVVAHFVGYGPSVRVPDSAPKRQLNSLDDHERLYANLLL